MLAEDLDTRVDELLILQHLQACFAARVPEVGAEDDCLRRLASGQTAGIDGTNEMIPPRLLLTHAPEYGIQLDARDIPRGNVLELQ
jgi:hypothetical protein